MTPQQIKQQEELQRLQTKLHVDWLKHPVTQDFVKVLYARRDNQVKELQDGILSSSDEKKEIKYRASIQAMVADIVIATDTIIFVQELNKLTPNNQ